MDKTVDIRERLFARFPTVVVSAGLWRGDLINEATSTLALANECLIVFATKAETRGDST